MEAKSNTGQKTTGKIMHVKESQHVENDLKVYSVFFAVVAKEVNECFCNLQKKILFRHKVYLEGVSLQKVIFINL